jgi:hypothetical protein
MVETFSQTDSVSIPSILICSFSEILYTWASALAARAFDWSIPGVNKLKMMKSDVKNDLKANVLFIVFLKALV